MMGVEEHCVLCDEITLGSCDGNPLCFDCYEDGTLYEVMLEVEPDYIADKREQNARDMKMDMRGEQCRE